MWEFSSSGDEVDTKQTVHSTKRQKESESESSAEDRKPSKRVKSEERHKESASESSDEEYEDEGRFKNLSKNAKKIKQAKKKALSVKKATDTKAAKGSESESSDESYEDVKKEIKSWKTKKTAPKIGKVKGSKADEAVKPKAKTKKTSPTKLSVVHDIDTMTSALKGVDTEKELGAMGFPEDLEFEDHTKKEHEKGCVLCVDWCG